MRRLALVAALAPALACDPLVETPAPLRAQIVSPTSGTQLREAGALPFEVALDGCSEIDYFNLYSGDELVLFANLGYVDFDRYPDDCPLDHYCINLFPSDLLAAGPLQPVELRAEVFCASADYAATSDPILLAVSPFTGSVTLPADGEAVELVALPGGLVAAQTAGQVRLIDGGSDRVLATRAGVGRPLVVGNRLLYADADELVRLSPVDLSLLAGPAALECAPIAAVAGPLFGQITVYGNDPAPCWHIFNDDLQAVASGSLPRVALPGGRPATNAVRVAATAATAPFALARLDITAAGVDEVDLGVTLASAEAAALADDATWLLAREGAALYEIDATTGARSAVGSETELGELRSLTAQPAGIGVLAWGSDALLTVSPGGYAGTGAATDLAIALPEAMAYVDDRARIQVLSTGIGFADPIYGPVPDTWQPIAGAAGRDGWFHIAYQTPLGLIVGSIEPDLEEP